MKKKHTEAGIVILFALMTGSCTLHYGEQQRTEDKYPELTFSNVTVTRYEDASETMQIKAAVLEQYKNQSLYAREAKFKIWNEDKELETEGSCTLLGIDTENEIYSMFNSIRVKTLKQDMELYAENLMWNAKTEQLISGKNDLVSIKQDGVSISGTGFSASGISKNFSFTGAVTGTVQNDEGGEK